MKILVACEESQIVTEQLIIRGHQAFSCDLQPCSGSLPALHIQDDALKIAYGEYWDMMIGHPPCTYLCVSGNAWKYHPDDQNLPTWARRPHPKYLDRDEKTLAALEFFKAMWEAPIEKIALENPVGVVSTQLLSPTQTIQPWHFGDPHAKATCLWLKNLPRLRSTKLVDPDYVKGSDGKWRSEWYNKTRDAKGRSKTFPGIAKAMAEQWTDLAMV